LLALAFTHRHGPQFMLPPSVLAMNLLLTFTTGC